MNSPENHICSTMYRNEIQTKHPCKNESNKFVHVLLIKIILMYRHHYDLLNHKITYIKHNVTEKDWNRLNRTEFLPSTSYRLIKYTFTEHKHNIIGGYHRTYNYDIGKGQFNGIILRPKSSDKRLFYPRVVYSGRWKLQIGLPMGGLTVGEQTKNSMS